MLTEKMPFQNRGLFFYCPPRPPPPDKIPYFLRIFFLQPFLIMIHEISLISRDYRINSQNIVWYRVDPKNKYHWGVVITNHKPPRHISLRSLESHLKMSNKKLVSLLPILYISGLIHLIWLLIQFSNDFDIKLFLGVGLKYSELANWFRILVLLRPQCIYFFRAGGGLI